MVENRIYNGDCLSLMKDIGDGSCQLILADLPFGVLNKSNPAARWDCVLPFDELWSHYKRVIKPNGAICLFSQGLFTSRLKMSNEKMWRYDWIWHKGVYHATGFLNANRQPMRDFETVCVFSKRQTVYHPQKLTTGLKHKRGGNNGHSNTYGGFHKMPEVEVDAIYPRSIIEQYPNDTSTAKRLHPTEKPVPLLRYLIRTYTDEGDLVLDNTCGSGSTCVAALLEKRRFIGIEKEREYYEIACKRVEDAERGMRSDLFNLEKQEI